MLLKNSFRSFCQKGIKNLLPKTITKDTINYELNGLVVDGMTFNKHFGSFHFGKLINKNLQSRDYHYKLGLNIEPNYQHEIASSNGIYFTLDLNHWFHIFRGQKDMVVPITIPNDPNVYVTFGIKELKASAVIIGEMEIYDWTKE